MLQIRRAVFTDFDQIWPIIQETFEKADTYVFSPDTTKKEGFCIWMETSLATYVAVEDEKILGTYFLKSNQPGLGSHICNAGYIVSSKARGRGIGKVMCEHSLKEAVVWGFKGMQYNFVVSTNQVAVKLWQKCGFSIVGTLYKAFKHKEKGFVDAYVMYQWFGEKI